MVSETNSVLTSVAPTRGVFIPHAEGSLPEKVRECPAVPKTCRWISLKGRTDVKCDYRGVVVWFLAGVKNCL